MNAASVKWPGGQIGVDRKLRAYLEGGQLIEPPDTRAGEVKFKLHECFPNARYIVTDHSIAPARGDDEDGVCAASTRQAPRSRRDRKNQRLHGWRRGIGTDGGPALGVRLRPGRPRLEALLGPLHLLLGEEGPRAGVAQ